MRWFTADTHFGHANVLEHAERPFPTVEEMNETMINNWNNVVGRGDVIYHLGDFWLGKAAQAGEAQKILSRLNGTKLLVCGNHDGRTVKSLKGWAWVGDYKKVKFDKQAVILFHYAIRSWHHRSKGAWHLYGHSHGNLAEEGKSFDVGVDCNDYRPISLEEVSSRMAGREAYHDHRTY